MVGILVLGKARATSISIERYVRSEQRSPKPKAPQPEGQECSSLLRGPLRVSRQALIAALGLLLVMPLLAQDDPAAREDEKAAREKLLRAADQIDVLQSSNDANTAQIATLKSSNDQLRTDLDAAKADIAALKAENADLHAALEKLDAARLDEEKTLLDKVSKIVADAGKHPAADEPPSAPDTPAPSTDKPAADAKPPATASSDDKGFVYVVVKGDTLHAIAAAYQANGVKVTVADIRKANNMTAKDMIRTGQKLFIPKS